MAKFPARFSLTIPSEAAKKARMCEMKCRSFVLSLSQSLFVCCCINICLYRCVFVVFVVNRRYKQKMRFKKYNVI